MFQEFKISKGQKVLGEKKWPNKHQVCLMSTKTGLEWENEKRMDFYEIRNV